MGRRRGRERRAPSGVLTGLTHPFWFEARQNGRVSVESQARVASVRMREGDRDCDLSKHAGTVLRIWYTEDQETWRAHHVYFALSL
jgi:hypothetical protein